jgi:glycosyltransferase involved in cell wall biosynthesis
MPKVSVVIPTYNRATPLVEAIQSVLKQTYTDFELIVIDDGSTDDTRNAILPYSHKVKYLYQERGGVSKARNYGIKVSRGEYIAFLDSDDLWLDKKLEVQVNFMKAHKSFISYTDEIWIRGGKRVNPGKRHRKYSGWIFDKVLPLCIISPSSVMIRREVFDRIGLFDEHLPACEDYDMWIRVAKHYPIHLIEQQLIVKRGGREDQLSRTIWGLDRFRIKSLVRILQENSLSCEERELVLSELRRKCQIFAQGCFKRNRVDEGKFYKYLPERYSAKGSGK